MGRKTRQSGEFLDGGAEHCGGLCRVGGWFLSSMMVLELWPGGGGERLVFEVALFDVLLLVCVCGQPLKWCARWC